MDYITSNQVTKSSFMKYLLILCFIFNLSAVERDAFGTLIIGEQAPAWSLKGVDDKDYKLSNYQDKDVLMIVFTANHCPEAQAAEWRLKKIVEDYKDKSFALVAISGNSPEGMRLDELRFAVRGDSFEEMKDHAKEHSFNFPYLYDGDTQEVTKAYGALSTPHVFILNKERKLAYHGRLDDSKTIGDIKHHHAREAIDELLAGKAVTITKTRPFGCSTKWKSKAVNVAKDNEAWKAQEVLLETIGAEQVKSLAANKTDKYRLINLWATWCGPCVAELPELVKIKRIYQHRNFETITISIDKLNMQKKALAYLRDEHMSLGRTAKRSIAAEGRKTNNYIWNGSDLDTLAKNLDPQWPGPVPYTILIAPGGEIVHRQVGEFDSMKLKQAIIKGLGRFRK